MPSKGDTQINTFVGGLNTEASPLSFPPNSSLDEKNFRLNRNGSRDRRLGLDYEDDYALYDTGQTTDQIKVSRQRVFVWPTPSGWNQVEIGVIQVGTKLYFVNLFTANPSANVLHGGSSLDAADITSIIDNTVVFDFTIVNNNLIVVSEGLDTPFLLSYDYPSDTILYQTARIKIRDLYGVSDGLSDNERPVSLTPAHEYNLRNQGWNSEVVTTCGTEVLACTQSVLGVYPSNSDTWSLGKVADVTSADIDKYDPNTLARNSFDLGRAAMGHFIIDLYNRGSSRETESGITQTNVDRELGRISTVAAMGGRLFYSGIRSRISGSDVSPKLSGAVLFSQIGLTNEQLIRCYQEADPTSPNSSDIVDTDGGIVQISEASNIVKLMQVKTSIFVFADNGIWEIRGDEGGFRATSFQVNKISSIGVLSRDSIVEANGTIFFWADQGIFAVTPNQFQTGYDSTNVSISLIQTAYNSIPDLAKQNARGYYDVSQNRVRWLFNSDVSETITIPSPDPIVYQEGSQISGPDAVQLYMSDVTDTSYMIAYRDSGAGNFLKAVVVSIDPVTLAPTMGSAITINAASASNFKIKRLEDNKILCWYTVTTGIKGRILTVSGTSFTVGAENSLVAIASTTGISGGNVLTSTKAVLLYNASAGVSQGVVLNISGDTITPAGTSYAIAASSSNNLSQFSVETIDSSTIIFAGIDGTGSWIRTLSVSGDVITANTKTTIPTSINSGSIEQVRIAVLTSTLATITGIASTVTNYGSINISGTSLTIPAGSIIAGTLTFINTVSIGFSAIDSTKTISITSGNVGENRAVNYLAIENTASTTSIYKTKTLLYSATQTSYTQSVSMAGNIFAWVCIPGTSSGPLITQAIRVP